MYSSAELSKQAWTDLRPKVPVVSVYRDELFSAQRQGAMAHDAMERWVSAPVGAPEVPGAILEGYAKDLRESRERILKLIADQGERDDISSALAENEQFHRSLGLSIRDKPEIEPEPE